MNKLRLCRKCGTEFEGEHYQTLNCAFCKTEMAKQRKTAAIDRTSSPYIRRSNGHNPSKVKPIMTNAEQKKIDAAYILKFYPTPDPGRHLEGEEFEKVAQEYLKRRGI
jgi:hypothetical protein